MVNHIATVLCNIPPSDIEDAPNGWVCDPLFRPVNESAMPKWVLDSMRALFPRRDTYNIIARARIFDSVMRHPDFSWCRQLFDSRDSLGGPTNDKETMLVISRLGTDDSDDSPGDALAWLTAYIPAAPLFDRMFTQDTCDGVAGKLYKIVVASPDWATRACAALYLVVMRLNVIGGRW